MKLLVVGTVNGKENEGMRNVITHLSKALEKKNTIKYASLKDINSIIYNSPKCDAVLICARATAKVYFLTKLIRLFYKRVFFIIVQNPEKGFLKLNSIIISKCNYLPICKDDMKLVKLHKGYNIYPIKVGINAYKFKALALEARKALKLKYGFSLDKPVILHVGHCSSGRGLEDFGKLDTAMYQCIVVSSGLFEDKGTVQKLKSLDVKLLNGFLPNIEELYQLADVYLFPTKTREFVISIPLSVMEALACGTPVISYKQFENIKMINVMNAKAIKSIDNSDDLNLTVKNILPIKTDKSLLRDSVSWDESADEVMKILEECL